MPLCFMLARASLGKSGNTGLKTDVIPDSGTRVGMTTVTSPRDTRPASRRARTLSSANWKALNPVTTSNEPFSHGKASMSPTRKSPSGTRSAAISINSSAASSLPRSLPARRPCARRVQRRTRSRAPGCPNQSPLGRARARIRVSPSLRDPPTSRPTRLRVRRRRPPAGCAAASGLWHHRHLPCVRPCVERLGVASQ